MKFFAIISGVLILIGIFMQIALVSGFIPTNLAMYESAIQYFILTGFGGILTLILAELMKPAIKALRAIIAK